MPDGIPKWGVGSGKPTVPIRLEEERNAPGRPWQRAFAVIGIVTALCSIVLIVPGLLVSGRIGDGSVRSEAPLCC